MSYTFFSLFVLKQRHRPLGLWWLCFRCSAGSIAASGFASFLVKAHEGEQDVNPEQRYRATWTPAYLCATKDQLYHSSSILCHSATSHFFSKQSSGIFIQQPLIVFCSSCMPNSHAPNDPIHPDSNSVSMLHHVCADSLRKLLQTSLREVNEMRAIWCPLTTCGRPKRGCHSFAV